MTAEPYIIQWNINGIETRKKNGELERLIAKYNPMCICLQHLGKNDVAIKNYRIAKQSQNLQGELGTAIYVHNSITYDDLQVNSTNFQITSITLHVPGKGKINVINFYNQPIFHYNINDLINILTSVQHPKLMLGDINRHSPMWDSRITTPDADAKKIEDMIERSNITCLNEEDSFTFFSKAHNKMTTVDISLGSDDILEEWEWHVLDDAFSSDHFPIMLTNLRATNTEESNKRYRTKCADWRNFTRHTNEIQDFDENLSSEESYNILKQKILEAADNHIPITSGKRRRKQVPWWSHRLQELVDTKHKIGNLINRKTIQLQKIRINDRNGREREEKINKIEEEIRTKLKPELNKTNAIFKREASKAKEESWKKYVTSLNSNTPMKKIWKRFRKISGSDNKAPRHAIWHEGKRVHEPEEVCKIIGEHLQNISSNKFYNKRFQKYKENVEKKKIKFEEDLEQKEYYNVKFKEEELMEALKTSNDSAPGNDKINFEMIKHLSNKAKTYLLKLYNHLWERKEFIKEWREAIIIPIPKPGKDPSNVTNYRPVSLTSCLCKTFEKMVNARLTWFLKENGIISDIQYGSMKNRSTLDPLMHLEHHIREAFKRKAPTIAVFYDIEKAYDTTWKYPIMAKLKEANMKGQMPNFIDNFLKERTFKVRIDAKTSDTFHLTNSIPQGSVLSCTLFHLAIEDLVKNLPRVLRKSLYMDDFVIYISMKKLKVAARIINLANRKIEEWEAKTGFKMAEGKTKIVIFYRDKRWIKGQDISITLNNKIVEIEEKYKYLGVIFDSHLNWGHHISYTKTRCRKALKLLKKLSHTTWGADRKTLRTLYRATVLPILDYGSQVYGSATQAKLSQLESIHNEGARIITGAFRSTYAPSLHVEGGDLPLDLHRELVTMKSAIRIQSTDSPVKNLFNEEGDEYPPQAPFAIRAKRLFSRATLQIEYPEAINATPPWMLKRAEFCSGLMSLSKADNPNVIRTKAIAHIQEKNNSYNLYTDGSKSEAGVGYAVVSQDNTVKKSLPEVTSIYTAELAALREAVHMIENINHDRFVIYSDSKSALIATQSFNPKCRLVKEVQMKIDSLIRMGKSIMMCWVPAHVGLRGNEAADRAAKEAVGEERSDVIPLATDYYPLLREAQYKKWQNRWDAEPPRNKLKSVKKQVKPWKPIKMDRTTEVIIARLRLGHTRITHCHLMENPNGSEPRCTGCQTRLSVQHMLVDCPLVAHQRRSTIGGGPLSKILGPELNTGKLTTFLKLTKIFDVI